MATYALRFQSRPHFALPSPVRFRCQGAQVAFGDSFWPMLNDGQEEYRFLDVGGEQCQIYDLRNPGPPAYPCNRWLLAVSWCGGFSLVAFAPAGKSRRKLSLNALPGIDFTIEFDPAAVGDVCQHVV